MEANDFIERRSDPDDGRMRRVFLMPAGTKLVQAIRENVELVELRILIKTPKEFLDQTVETLMIVKDTLFDIINGSPPSAPSQRRR